MRPKSVFLVISLVICVFLIALVLLKGTPPDKVSLDSVSEVIESVLHHTDEIGKILTAVSDEEEIEIGERIYKRSLKYRVLHYLKGSPLDKYVTAVGNEVAGNVKRRKIKYKFHIVDSWCPNAFACPGGHIYISIGLLKELESEAELAAILGHEITHVDAKHAIGAIQYKIAAGKIVEADIDTFADIGYQLLFRPGYSEVQEYEADIGGVYLAYKCGYHPLAVINAFENICSWESSGKRTEFITPLGDTLTAAGEFLGRYFATHPLTAERIDRIKEYVKDNKMTTETRKFYLGQKNYIEKKLYTEARYREEFRKEYVIIKDKDETEGKVYFYDETTNELYTIYGRLYVGMNLSELEKILPERLKEFKKDIRIGYENVRIYRFHTRELEDTVKILIDLDNQKVTKIRIIKGYKMGNTERC